MTRHTLCAAAVLLAFALPVAADDMQDATRFFKQKAYDQSLDKVEAVLKAKPKDAQARFLKGLILTEQGRASDAIRTFTSLTEDYPELPEPYNNLAVLYASQEQYDKARIALEMAIRTHPSYATAYENLGDIYAKMASQAYDRALQQDKNNASTQTKLALINDLFTNRTSRTVRGSSTPTLASAAPVAPPAAPAAPVAAAKPAAPAVVPTPIAPPAPAKPAAKVTASAKQDIESMANAWAKAWAARDVSGYLAFYAAEFNPPGGMKRGDWEQQRKERINKPEPIVVELSKLSITVADDSHGSVTFRQHYQSGRLNSYTLKTLDVIRHGDLWQISDERNGQ